MSRVMAASGVFVAILMVWCGLVWAAHVWTNQRVDGPAPPVVGNRSCTVLDGDGYPHISYADTSNADLKYAHWDGTRWVIEVVDNGANVALAANTAIDLDSAGRAHISYYQATPYLDLKHARRDGPDNWFVESVDTTGDMGYYSSLKVDSSDRIHLAYYDNTGKHLKYALHDAGGWTIQTVDSSSLVGFLCSLELDSLDNPHIVYNDNQTSTAGLKYVWWNGSGWATRPSIGGGTSARLALDSTDTPHLAYLDRTLTRKLWYATWTGTTWSTEVLDASADSGGPPGIAIGPDGRVQIAYVTGNAGNLVTIARNGGTWDFETANDSGQVYSGAWLVVGSANDPQVSYYNYILGSLWYTVTRGPLAVRWPR